MESEREDNDNRSTLVGWALVPVWVFILLVVFQDYVDKYPAYVAVLQVLFPAILLGAATGRLFTSPKGGESKTP